MSVPTSPFCFLAAAIIAGWLGYVGVAAEPVADSAAEPAKAAEAEPAPSGDTDLLLESPQELFARAVYYSARRGSHWLQSMQRPDGTFVYGWIPSLNRPMDGNNHLRQAGAAMGLARAACYTQDQNLSLAARQAILVLLTSHTAPDPENEQICRPTVAPSQANPVGFAGLLLLAISELPDPSAPLLDHGDLLARFLQSRQREDGSLNIADTLYIDDDPKDDPAGISFYPGEALYALMRNHSHRPADWKLEVVDRAFSYYRDYWKQNPEPSFIPWQTAAYAEAYLWTKKPEYAAFVLEMNDWLLQFQYTDATGTPTEWSGGFASLHDGHILRTEPTVATGSYAEGLVDACRLAEMFAQEKKAQVEQAGDDPDAVAGYQTAEKRATLYRHAVERCFQFLMRTQYNISEATHYEHWYREKLNGAFHGGVADGTVRIDFAQHAVCAMFHYLTHIADFDPTRLQQQSAANAN